MSKEAMSKKEAMRIELRFDPESPRQMRVFEALKGYKLRKGDLIRLYCKLIEDHFNLEGDMRQQVIAYLEGQEPPQASHDSKQQVSRKEEHSQSQLNAGTLQPDGVEKSRGFHSKLSGLARRG